MHRKGKFHSSRSFKHPFFVDSVRESHILGALKRYSARKIRHLSLDEDLSDGSSFKRMVDTWSYYDHGGSIHRYCHLREGDIAKFRVIIKAGKHYFPK